MKKFQILCFAILSMALFSSCNDDSGTYVSQLFTDSQKSLAIKTCLEASTDTAVNHLCVSNGFSGYNNGVYRIDYSGVQNVFDTLAAHDYGYLNDSLILFTNRMAEGCGVVVKTAFKDAIGNLVVHDLDELINGDDHAITDYFVQMKSHDLREAMRTPVGIRMDIYKVTETWNDMAGKYYTITNKPLTYDVQGYVIDKMLNGLFEEMRNEEYLIRTDSTHRNSADSLLGL
ncbi:MAG: DUF4197 domain-containing protein [Bacteroidales bacterium]|nr:DUF4197 domain-containing protein [Bacteroidales bacterium]